MLEDKLLQKNQDDDSQQAEVILEPLGILSQIWLLVYKNIILTIKNPKNLIFLIITPFLLSGFMSIFQSLAKDNGERTLPNPPAHAMPQFPHCIGEKCISLKISTMTQNNKQPDWVSKVQKYIKDKAQLNNEQIESNHFLNDYESLRTYYKNLSDNPNKTQIGLIFCGQNITNGLEFFCNKQQNYTYYLLLNKTDSLSVIFHDLLEPLPIDPVAASLKALVDNALLNLESEKDEEKYIDYSISQFPVAKNRYLDNYDIVSQIGAFYYMITPLFPFLFIQSQIVREKEYKLRQGLNIFGASHAAYWISWLFVANLYALVVAISTFLAGLTFQFGFFTQTPFYIIIFAMIYPFTLAMQTMAFFLSTLSPTLKAANAISYGIVLFAIVVQSFMADNTLLVFLFDDDESPLIAFLKYFLSFYPPFSYTKMFTNITTKSGYHFDLTQRQWVDGGGYQSSVFIKQVHGKLYGGNNYTRYSDLFSMLILFGDMLFYIILTWYFDHVVASNRGKGESFLFPFYSIKRILYDNRKARVVINPEKSGLQKVSGYLFEDQDDSARKQRIRVHENSQYNIPAMGMRVKNLSKTFKSFFSSEKVQAIKNFNLQIDPNELMAILGHNGAGKTTLIQILTGVLTPDDVPGLQIIINGQNISNIDIIRKYIGVCSQFDILWNQLTAQDHLYMFARLKNVPLECISDKIDEILGFVNLSNEKHNIVKSFSGGMKRRLSLAICAIGNPKIILLDEPTTGLDPKVRQQVWKLIEKLKVNKSIILTTHSMEEADILADRLAIMVKGKLKCVGTSFQLKQKYGEGHRITLNICSTDSKEVMELLNKLFSSVVEVDCKGGNLILGIKDFKTLLKLVKMLESKDSLGLDEHSLKQMIKDWSVSQSTLQEVFITVTKQKQE